MIVANRESAPYYERDNIKSFLLISKYTSDSDNLAISVVEMEPGGFQHEHSHDNEQMYYILEGRGTMTVDGEKREVGAGDCIFFPSNAVHGLVNQGDAPLKYLSASHLSFSYDDCKRLWPENLKD